MAQQYLPRSYSAPRYANQSLGVPYVSAYDPSLVDRYGQLMNQEYAKAMAANQGMAAREGEIADIFSLDEEGKQQVLGAYKDKTKKITESYGGDLALAAPELARSIVAERANPWYAKNVLYNKEHQRRQKLTDQYGPNIQFLRDLPEGNLQDMDMEDIGFDYYNKLHVQQALQDQYGDYAKKITDLGMRDIEGYPAFVKQLERKGLTETEAQDLIAEEGQEFIKEYLEGAGLPVTPENIQRLSGEARDWALGSLVGGEDARVMQNPAFDTSGGGGGFNIPENSLLVPLEETIPATPKRKEAKKGGIDLMNRANTGQLTYEENQALQQDPGLLERIGETPAGTAFVDTLPQVLEGVPADTMIAAVGTLRNDAQGAKSAENAIESVLEEAGALSFKTRLTPQGSTRDIYWNGKKITERNYEKMITPLKEEFKKARSFNNSPEGVQLAKDVNAAVNKPVSTTVYGISREGNADTKTYVNDVVLATSANNLVDSGAYMSSRGESKPYDPRKSERKLDNLKDPAKERQFGTVVYKESGSKGAAPELILETNEGDLHLPLTNEQGYEHGMQLSLLARDPKVVNDVFTSLYDKELTKQGGEVPMSDFFGREDLAKFGLGTIQRRDVGGQRKYVAPVAGQYQIEASTPNELLLKVAHYVNLASQEQQISVMNPTLAFMMKRVADLATPKETKEDYYGRIGQFQ